MSELREKLAALAHEQWSGWMEHVFRRCEAMPGTITGEVAPVVIPLWAVENWGRQMLTPYAELSEEEKDSDRKEADRVLKLLGEDGPLLHGNPPHALTFLGQKWVLPESAEKPKHQFNIALELRRELDTANDELERLRLRLSFEKSRADEATALAEKSLANGEACLRERDAALARMKELEGTSRPAQAHCTGVLMHDDFTPCPVHDAPSGRSP